MNNSKSIIIYNGILWQVYKVDEAITTKWDWKKGILPVLSETKSKSPAAYDQVATNPDESPEVFAW